MTAMPPTHEANPAIHQPGGPSTGGPVSTVKARSQWQIFWRKFVRHKAAMASAIVLTIIVVSVLFVDSITPYLFSEQNFSMMRQPPTLEGWHIFGTDSLGRDSFTRVLYGTRTSLYVAGIVALGSTLIGTIVGGLSGYYRGGVDAVLMRFSDLILVIPNLAFLLTIAALIGVRTPLAVAVVLALLFWVPLARIVRGSFLSLREKEYVEAAKASGASDLRIMYRHMLPNAIGPIIVNATLVIATAILVEATLAFLGFGVQPPTPALGVLINEGRAAVLTTTWWLIAIPGLVLVVICLCINFLGDGLRDALDPTQSEG